jgi:hypothetical protein
MDFDSGKALKLALKVEVDADREGGGTEFRPWSFTLELANRRDEDLHVMVTTRR